MDAFFLLEIEGKGGRRCDTGRYRSIIFLLFSFCGREGGMSFIFNQPNLFREIFPQGGAMFRSGRKKEGIGTSMEWKGMRKPRAYFRGLN
jgi:hypothetical protein